MAFADSFGYAKGRAAAFGFTYGREIKTPVLSNADFILLSGDQQTGTDAIALTQVVNFATLGGEAVVFGFGSALANAVGSASGVATASAVGQATGNDSVGMSAGVATVSGALAADANFAGTAAGSATGTGISEGSGTATAEGLSAATARSSAIASAAGMAAGIATVEGAATTPGPPVLRLSAIYEPVVALTGIDNRITRLPARYDAEAAISATLLRSAA